MGAARGDHPGANHQMVPRGAAPIYASSLVDQVRCHLGTSGGRLAAEAASLREALAGRLTDPRNRRGIRHPLVSVLMSAVTGRWSTCPG